MEPWQESLENAKQQLKIADHMSYVALTILKENRLLIKIMSSLANSVLDLIKAFLHYEYSLRKVKLYKDSNMNFKTFRERIAPKYMQKDDYENLIKILIYLIRYCLHGRGVFRPFFLCFILMVECRILIGQFKFNLIKTPFVYTNYYFVLAPDGK